MHRLLFPTALLALTLPAGAVTFTIDAEILKDAAGFAMDPTGLVVLTAATTGTFLGPTATAFATGSEIVVQTWDLSAFATAGVLSDIAANLPFTGAWDAGDPLKLYWYPTLTLATLAPGAGTPFGSYTDAVGIDGSDAWITPAESATISLKFFTSDVAFLTGTPGSNAPTASEASQTVVPEPTTAVLLGATFGALALRRRRR